VDTATDTPAKIPWNKGKIVGQKAPLNLKTSGLSAYDFNWVIEFGSLRFLILG
jgi:hypothetical protein